MFRRGRIASSLIHSSTFQRFFNKISRVPAGYWEDEQNVIHFLSDIKTKLNLQSLEDWNSISVKQIKSNGGASLLKKYSIYELKCLGYPNGKNLFNKPVKLNGYWKNKNNIHKFLENLKEKYNLKTQEDWNSITTKQIHLHGGSRLFFNYSLFDLKCMGFPEGKLFFEKQKTNGYWNNHENILQFLKDLGENFNLKSLEDWNSITKKHIQSLGGSSLLKKYSIYELKCLAFPNGKDLFDRPNYKNGHWNNKDNVIQFLNELKEKYNLKTKEDWNSITGHLIKLNGGRSLLVDYSMYDLKCLGFPEGKLFFDKPIQSKPSGYWDNHENILQFLDELKIKFNLQSKEDWNSITQKQIDSCGGKALLKKYSMFDLKCLGFPDGISFFDKPIQSKPFGYWNDIDKRNFFFEKLKVKYKLNTPEDWKRLSKFQIRSQGGHWLFNNNYLEDSEIFFDIQKDNSTQSISFSVKELLGQNIEKKRSNQRWLFLQVQNLFPHDEIVEDYFHPEISRESGFSVQFDIFLIQRNIAIEYHGQQHYEDIPSGFAPLEMHKIRDEEKRNLCLKHGIQLIVIPYWWDNKIDSLRETLNSSIKNIV